MKKNALVVIGILVVLVVGVIGVSAQGVAQSANVEVAAANNPKLKIEDARAIALKKVPGTVEDEFPFEEDGKITSYTFIIIRVDKKVFTVEIDANSGKILFEEEDK